ncbi:MAG: hypothetical protein JJ975_08225 [Bacteroidia bacterium]|nr:hypothetical protein [Bacteroidia bacterium]
MTSLVIIHSIVRWLVVISLLTSLVVAWSGYGKRSAFTQRVNKLRHWTATLAHCQLVIGITLAFRSPYFTHFWHNLSQPNTHFDFSFYGLIHPGLMTLAIATLTIGSAKTKRSKHDRNKFRTMLIWFTVSAVIIIIAIPWPFSPLSARPLIRIYH